MKKLIIPLVAVAALVGCGGGGSTHKLKNGAPEPKQAAPPCHVTTASGAMGSCAPKPPPGQTLSPPPGASSRSPGIVDLSNNDPVYGPGQRAIRRHGFVGEIDKVNQANYIDPTYARMVHDARSVGLRVGGYDFIDPGHATATREASNFVGRLKATGTCAGRGVIPPTADVEYGSISRTYLQTWGSIVKRSCHRYQIYTGQWYWNPHLGCWWPSGVPGWISGYGAVYLPCTIGSNYRIHQWTDRGFNGARTSDLSIFIGSGSQFDSYTGNTAPKPKPKPRPLPKRKSGCPARHPFLNAKHAPGKPSRACYRVVLRPRRHYYDDGSRVKA